VSYLVGPLIIAGAAPLVMAGRMTTTGVESVRVIYTMFLTVYLASVCTSARH